MKAQTVSLSAVILCFLVLAVIPAHAGGPLLIGNTTLGVEGEPLVWDNSVAISYRTDGGNLGTLTNAQANERVRLAFEAWHSVSTASIAFQRAGQITGIADGDVSTLDELDRVLQDCNNGTQIAVIYDADGRLFLDLFSDPNVIGFTGPCAVSMSGKIVSGLSALNGYWVSLGDEFDAVMVHEFGHLIGLDHSQIDCLDVCLADDDQALPTMYPFLVSAEQKSLAPDDIAWLSTLYPSGLFKASYGRITGQVLFSDGITPVQGANLVFRQVDNPATPVDESRSVVFSAVSGYRFTGNPGQPYTSDYLPCTVGSYCEGGFLDDNRSGNEFGSHDPRQIGTFDIWLPPGSYTVEVQSIDAGFSGGSGVGPLSPPIPLPGLAEFWNTSESATDDPAARDAVMVTVGNTVSGIDIILNGTPPRFDQFEKSDFSQAIAQANAWPASRVNLRFAGGTR